jgi:NIMA (never in mitosis gene a)-related kinase
MSPEALGRAGYGEKSDVWSLGCIIYEMCCSKQCFDGRCHV